MSKPIVDEVHIRHCMLLFFDQGMNATKTTESIIDLYGSVLAVNKCQRWFRKFKSGDRNLQDAPRSERPSNFDDDILKSLVESDARLIIEEVSQKLHSPWSTVQEHLKRIGKTNRMGIWTPHELSDDNKEQRKTICNSLLIRYRNEPFCTVL
ncbi:histone-lysine N-methyltransferase SETMAR-like [Ooceraea biroi]|uniref:histone-lysine N-methyltransferase SETMAR-like n=1 Tax=Ooceraea biroi TaxID=2015173 RepID=UPI000F07FA9D|nr:histone-lysine N-methyltransferase SETMAR-like [Ooceraea biroi]